MYRHGSCNTNLYCSNSYDINLDRVTDSHDELNSLDDTQECLNNSHHKIAFHGVFSKVTQKLVLCKVKDFLTQPIMSL